MQFPDFEPTAKVICDSIAPNGSRLTTIEATIHRFVLAELNTHRAFCLSGDTELYFDLPNKNSRGRGRRIYKITLGDFYARWHQGAASRRNNPRKPIDIDRICPTQEYRTDLFAAEFNTHKGNLHRAIHEGRLIAVRRDVTPRNRFGRLYVKGSEFIRYFSSVGENHQPVRRRLERMQLRQLNEQTREYQHCNVNDVMFSGVKECFRVVTSSGQQIEGSGDHLVLTENGWKTISDLLVCKDRIAGTYEEEPYFSKPRIINGKNVAQWNREVKGEVVTRQGGVCAKCEKRRKLEIHHVVPIHKDASKALDIDNVVAICERCHKQEHTVQGWQVGNPLTLRFETVITVLSIGPRDTYDLSVSGDYANFVANGLVVHNSRNSASSRAIPIGKNIGRVRSTPALPVHWGANQKGMQAATELTGERLVKAKTEWKDALNDAVEHVEHLELIGLHKQISNRLIEPWMPHTVIISATDWDGFFWQRCHPDAQPEMRAAAMAIQYAYYTSTPTPVRFGEWHLPYIQDDEIDALCGPYQDDLDPKHLEMLKKCSVARCARVSYLNHDGVRSYEDDLLLWTRLVAADIRHESPLEHVATPSLGVHKGNFVGWHQLRHLIPQQNLGKFIPNHPLLVGRA